MAWTRVANTEITGLAISGTDDGTGSWNVGVNVGTFVSVPPGATGALLEVANITSSVRWAGARTTGKTTPELLEDFGQRSHTHLLVPLSGAGLIDLYRETDAIVFRLLGFTGPETVYFDIDDTRPSVPSVGASWSTQNLSSIFPAGAQAFITKHSTVARYRTPGSSYSTTATGAAGKCTILPLNEARTLDCYYTSLNEPENIIGYVTSGFVSAFPAAISDHAGDSVYRVASAANPNAQFAVVLADNATFSRGWHVRAVGGSAAPSLLGSPMPRSLIAPLNDQGQFELTSEYTPLAPILVGWLGVASDGPIIDEVVPTIISQGSTPTIFGDGFGASPAAVVLSPTNDRTNIAATAQAIGVGAGNNQVPTTGVVLPSGAANGDTLYYFVQSQDLAWSAGYPVTYSVQPSLSAPEVFDATLNGFSFRFTTDTGNGTAIWAAYATEAERNAATVANIQAEIATPATSLARGQFTVTLVGVQTVAAVTGLGAAQTRYVRVYHDGNVTL